MMNKHHSEILKMLEKADKKEFGYFDLQKYLGTSKKVYRIDTLARTKILKEWKEKHLAISFDQYKELIASLNKGISFDEKIFSSAILNAYPKYLKQIGPEFIDKLLQNLSGWAEVDTLCQGTFGADQVLADLDHWSQRLEKFNKSKSISHRRASLVLLVKPCRESGDKRLSDLAFSNISNLAHEKEILITKAVSWLLRSMVKQNKVAVTKYLENNEERLPKIALRETWKKIKTGRK